MNTTFLLIIAFTAFFLGMQGNKGERIPFKKKKKFPNGFESWYETYFLICEFFVLERSKEPMRGKIAEIQESAGTAGMFSVSKEWADEFELLHKGEDWSELDFYDEVEEFCKLKNQ